MQYRELGRTGLKVSVISQGGAAIGQQYGPVSVPEVADCVHAAIDAGINLIDTSAFYGEGKSEEILGEVLKGGWREKTYICTKAGRLTRDKFDFTPAGMRTCLEGSLKRLGTDCVDILLAHDIEYADDYEFVFTETARVLQDFKREGKCRFIGMSCYPLGLLKLAIERCDLDAVVSYCHFSLQNTQLLTDLLPVAERRGVGLMNASPLSMGLLTNQGPQPWHPAPQVVKDGCRAAADFCRLHGADISTLGMQFCYAETRIPTTITGTAKKDELAVNLRALATLPDPKLLAEVQSVIAPVKDITWPSGNWKS
ncbi:aldo/keto reductase [Fimbriiglobus ruber]|uniref:Aldo-keto reductase n=1 Tax=Fimbriiglobus ruber TaxID=1908690 RepID=A0A225DPV1_9BACT|nr:aldo/keto reductase [Fimbriiglobus ruber]OWK43113.1 Aldo-keto reductase [Fimbriiglobus ruber]